MAGIEWTTPPEQMARAMEDYAADRVTAAVAAVAGFIASKMGNSARRNAPWTDRTGNARAGLFGTSEVDFARRLVTIYLSHGVIINYGVYLETRHGGRYAIIMRTIQAHLPELERMLQELFRD